MRALAGLEGRVAQRGDTGGAVSGVGAPPKWLVGWEGSWDDVGSGGGGGIRRLLRRSTAAACRGRSGGGPAAGCMMAVRTGHMTRPMMCGSVCRCHAGVERTTRGWPPLSSKKLKSCEKLPTFSLLYLRLEKR